MALELTIITGSREPKLFLIKNQKMYTVAAEKQTHKKNKVYQQRKFLVIYVTRVSQWIQQSTTVQQKTPRVKRALKTREQLNL